MPPNIRLPPSNASASENMLLRLFFFLSSSKSGVAQEGIQLSSLNAMPSLPVTVIKGKSVEFVKIPPIVALEEIPAT